MTDQVQQALGKWESRFGEKWREADVRYAKKFARIVVQQRLGLRSGLSKGNWSLGTGDLNGLSRREADHKRAVEIRQEVDDVLDELGLSKAEDPLRRVGIAMREAVVILDEADGPVSARDLDTEASYDAKRSSLRKLVEHGFADYGTEGQFEDKNGIRRLIQRYVITDEGREIAKLVRERETATIV